MVGYDKLLAAVGKDFEEENSAIRRGLMRQEEPDVECGSVG